MVAKRASTPAAPGQPAPDESAPAASGDSVPATLESAIAAVKQHDPQVAMYIAHLTGELGAMARAGGFDLLAYFLDMARIEANIQAGKE